MAYDDMSDHPFAIHMATERAGNEKDDWERWVGKAEGLVGHSLDGNQDADGYSLDWALECFNEGSTPEDFVAMIGDKDAAPSWAKGA